MIVLQAIFWIALGWLLGAGAWGALFWILALPWITIQVLKALD